jgi:hypothetical protein
MGVKYVNVQSQNVTETWYIQTVTVLVQTCAAENVRSFVSRHVTLDVDVQMIFGEPQMIGALKKLIALMKSPKNVRNSYVECNVTTDSLQTIMDVKYVNAQTQYVRRSCVRVNAKMVSLQMRMDAHFANAPKPQNVRKSCV